MVRLRSDPGQPDRPPGYAVTLPGLTTGQDSRSGSPAARSHLHCGSATACPLAHRKDGASPGADMFAGADAGQIYAYAAAVAQQAAAENHTARSYFWG